MSVDRTPSGEVEFTFTEAANMSEENRVAQSNALVEAMRAEIAAAPPEARLAVRKVLTNVWKRWKENES